MSDNNVFDFSAFPILKTERLTLRQLESADAEDMLAFSGDPYVQRFNGPVYNTVDEVEELVDWYDAEYRNQDGISWAVTFTGENKVIGMFGLHHWSRRHRRAEAGYDLAKAYWGQGIASETLRTILTFGFEQLNLHRIYAGTIADNHESVRLLERLGFTREGTRRESSWEDDGTFHDSAMYGLLRREWQFEK